MHALKKGTTHSYQRWQEVFLARARRSHANVPDRDRRALASCRWPGGISGARREQVISCAGAASTVNGRTGNGHQGQTSPNVCADSHGRGRGEQGEVKCRMADQTTEDGWEVPSPTDKDISQPRRTSGGRICLRVGDICQVRVRTGVTLRNILSLLWGGRPPSTGEHKSHSGLCFRVIVVQGHGFTIEAHGESVSLDVMLCSVERQNLASCGWMTFTKRGIVQSNRTRTRVPLHTDGPGM